MNFTDCIIIEQYCLFNSNQLCTVDTYDYFIDYIIKHKIMVYKTVDDVTAATITANSAPTMPRPIAWQYNDQNIRIPYPVISFYKLQEGDNIYDFISNTTGGTINPREFISGEKIQSLADVVVGTGETLNENPNNVVFSKNMMNFTIATIEDFRKYNRIFVFTHDMPQFYEKFGDEMEGRVLITHNSDDTAYIYPRLRCQFSQGIGTLDRRELYGLPIGIENRRWFYYPDLEQIVATVAKKTKSVYFYFSVETHSSRAECRQTLMQKCGLEWGERRAKKDYFKELALHRYCICPRGNGIDTHRIWEALYLNVIPIVIKADYTDALCGLPIVVLKSWADFDIYTLPTVFYDQQLSKITMNYWTSLVQNS
jgi:hypothetical protein